MRLLFIVASLFVVFVSSGQDLKGKIGLLVMAHGGSEDWNEAIENAVRPLRKNAPVSIAFGMADPNTLQAAVDDLVDQGATSIGVVRLFVSGESFLPETEFAFGLRTEKPAGHFMHAPRVLRLSIPVKISSQGLLDATDLGSLIADRASGLSHDPTTETVLIVGHGPGNDVENKDWLAKMDQFADAVRAAAGFFHVRVATLREDWTGKREMAETAMRQFITSETGAGRVVLIVPFRLFGFGPYADVFDGLSYRADSLGFLPDDRITKWIKARFIDLKNTNPTQSETESGKAN